MARKATRIRALLAGSVSVAPRVLPLAIKVLAKELKEGKDTQNQDKIGD